MAQMGAKAQLSTSSQWPGAKAASRCGKSATISGEQSRALVRRRVVDRGHASLAVAAEQPLALAV